MFGYVGVYPKELSPAARDRYQGYYCGLCRALRARYGITGQLSLSFDMTFAALLLSALYEPETTHGRGRCAAHPLRARPRAGNEFIDYTADMTAVLAYYNLEDNWQDEHDRGSRFLAARLKRFLPELRARWPGPCTAVEKELDALNTLEAAGSADLDALCGCFGRLLGAVFCPCGDDLWAPELLQLGRGLGGFIYLMDAYDDLEKDRKHGSFNALAPLAAALGPDEFELRCHQLLTEEMALCAAAFGRLPILKETPEGEILYNVLYSGVWGRYELRRAARERRTKTAKGAMPE